MRGVRAKESKSSDFSALGYNQIFRNLLKIFENAKNGHEDVLISAVFAAEILLDINAVCKSLNAVCDKDLIDTATMVMKSLDGILKTCERAH